MRHGMPRNFYEKVFVAQFIFQKSSGHVCQLVQLFQLGRIYSRNEILFFCNDAIIRSGINARELCKHDCGANTLYHRCAAISATIFGQGCLTLESGLERHPERGSPMSEPVWKKIYPLKLAGWLDSHVCQVSEDPNSYLDEKRHFRSSLQVAA